MSEMRVWHIPQFGAGLTLFNVSVDSLDQGVKILNLLWDYDLYQYDNNIKGDYSNVSGLEILNKENGWEEWDGFEVGLDVGDIHEYIDELEGDV